MGARHKRRADNSAQLFSVNGGTIHPGRVFSPVYPEWVLQGKFNPLVRHRQELEQYMLAHPGQHVPHKDFSSKMGVSHKAVEKVISRVSLAHGLPPRKYGSKLPINYLAAVEKAFLLKEKGQKMNILEAIYLVYKNSGGVVVSVDAAKKMLSSFNKLHNENRKIGRAGVAQEDNISVLRQKMLVLEAMEKSGVLDWNFFNGGDLTRFKKFQLKKP